MSFIKRKKGMTLIEIIITVAAFGLFSLLLVSLVVSSIRNYRRGRIMQDIRQKTSMALNYIKTDIQKSIPLPTPMGVSGGIAPWIPSGVLIPNAYGFEGTTVRGDAIVDPQDEAFQAMPGGGLSRDRTLMVLPKKELHRLDFSDLTNPANDNLVIVEYLVPTGMQNYLVRRTFRLNTSGDTGYVGYLNDGVRWMVTPSSFNDSFDVTSEYVAKLDGAIDTITFTVERPVYPSIDMQYKTWCDRNLFKVNVEMTRFLGDNPNHPVRHSEETEVSITAR